MNCVQDLNEYQLLKFASQQAIFLLTILPVLHWIVTTMVARTSFTSAWTVSVTASCHR